MKKLEFNYLSHDGSTNIRAVKYLPDGDVKAILQIAHGMVEFIDRYEGFAKFLCDQGYLVCGNDHLGHGGSVKSQNDWGYFAEKDGYLVVLEDLHELSKLIKKEYPNVPYYFMGHSMGSFFARLYGIKYGQEIDKLIIMGTGQQSAMALNAGKVLCRMTAVRKGWRYRSQTLKATAMGSYNKKWEPSDTHVDWLTKDEKIRDFYIHEPRCSYNFTVNGYYNLFDVIGQVIDENNIKTMRKDLPILITSGEDDPVGNFGKDPRALQEIFTKYGLNSTIKMYKDDRHEILNELDKETVYQDIYNFLNK